MNWRSEKIDFPAVENSRVENFTIIVDQNLIRFNRSDEGNGIWRYIAKWEWGCGAGVSRRCDPWSAGL